MILLRRWFLLKSNASKAHLSGLRLYHGSNRIYGYLSNQIEPLEENEASDQTGFALLTNAYRTYGHKKADLDPLGLWNSDQKQIRELNPSLYGLTSESGCTNDPPANSLLASPSAPSTVNLADAVQYLENKYCGTLTAEFTHLQTAEEREWFSREFESISEHCWSSDEKLRFAELMIKSQNFDHFLAAKFSTVKRYGGEGAESANAFYWQLMKESADNSVKDLILCMAHRGRLNLLSILLNFPNVEMFRKMKGKVEFPENVDGVGDVLSHLASSTEVPIGSGKESLHVTMLPNPSHLEAINPAAVGKARGRMETHGQGDYCSDPSNNGARTGDGVMCLQIHGDASFSGQGIVPEALQLSNIPHYQIGGSVHLILNNQIGYTTQADLGRSSYHCSDIAKLADCPVIHVNGDAVEDVARAARLAVAYRQRFRRDVFVNLICYRRWGHNELDDPSFTQPKMYAKIESRQSPPDHYAQHLMSEGVLNESVRSKWIEEQTAELNDAVSKIDSHQPNPNHLKKHWSHMEQAPMSVQVWDTGVDMEMLRFIGAKSVETPETMEVHPHLKKMHVGGRRKRLEIGEPLDWSTAEAMAFGSLLLQGYSIRISGEDVGRGTFSQRHCMLVDYQNDHIHIPLNHILSSAGDSSEENQKAFLEVANSALSEEAVLAFEWGMSIESPRRLCIWEAQFGDFFNGAQIIIDTLIASGETKWLTQSGLVMLLPHGIDGMGPEHSSCRIERFLQLTDSKENEIDGETVNFSMVNPTTSAQYFHLLRRQMIRPYRKPLVVASPKILLRFPGAMSPLSEFRPGTHFQPVLPDEHQHVDPKTVKKIILCSGKHYFTLKEERSNRGLTDAVALIRLESLCPFPAGELRRQIQSYPNATEAIIWSQEECRNSGAWTFVNPRLSNLLGVQAFTIREYFRRNMLAVLSSRFRRLQSESIIVHKVPLF